MSLRMPRPQTNNGSSSNNQDGWTGYQWNIPLDEVVDCDNAPECCRDCYLRHKEMSKKKKIIITLLLIAVIIVLTTLVVRFSLGDVDILLGAGNQRPIISDDTNFAPMMCSEYRLANVEMVRNPVSTNIYSSSPSFTYSTQSSSTSSMAVSTDDQPVFDAYLLLDMPYRSYQTKTFERVEDLHFPSEHYFNYWAFYLDSGSSVDIILSPPLETEIELRIVEGNENIKHILKTREVEGYSIDHIFIPTVSHRTIDANSFHFDARSTPDDYAFIFTISRTGNISMVNASLPVQFIIRLKELEFDDGAVFDSCLNASRCSLSVPNSAAAVMIEVNQTAAMWPIMLSAECVPDIGMYCAFFVGIPVACLLFFLSCAGVLYLCQESVMRDVERADRARASQGQSGSSRPSGVWTMGTTGSMISTSQRARLVDNDLLNAPPRYESLPPYQEIDPVPSPVSNVAPLDDDVLCTDGPNHPPPYESVIA